MDKTRIYELLGKLHMGLYQETHDFSNVDIDYYIKNIEYMASDIPPFNELSKKYTLKDASLSDELLLRYLSMYIYLEYLYDRVQNDKNEKDKLYDKIHSKGNDSNFFGYLKLYTVYYATSITKYFSNSFMLRLLSSGFLMLNISEAVITDLFHLRFTNSLIGMYLMVSVPFNVSNFSKDKHDNILCDFEKEWLDLYTSWNAMFTYSDSPGKNYFPRTSICLLNAYNHRNEWLNNRAYTLFASHMFKTFDWFNTEFGLDDELNEDLINDWNEENIDFLFK